MKVVTLESYISQFKTLSKAKEVMIRRLWQNDSVPFPKPWVASSELLALTGQKYFDRRIRELRDQQGCHIETAPINGVHSYRMRSSVRSKEVPRGYLTAKNKRSLFERFNYRCQICGSVFAGGVRGLQADHKIPLIRGGENSEENSQPICNECNVGKRSACKGCTDNCHRCPWAFPETVGITMLLRLSPPLVTALKDRAREERVSLEDVVACTLSRGLGIK